MKQYKVGDKIRLKNYDGEFDIIEIINVQNFYNMENECLYKIDQGGRIGVRTVTDEDIIE